MFKVFFLLLFLLLFLIKLDSFEGKDFFLRDYLFDVNVSLSGNVTRSSNLSFYIFVHKRYIFKPEDLKKHKKTPTVYLYGAKIKGDDGENSPFSTDENEFNVTINMKRAIYAHPDCNKCDSFKDQVNVCNGEPDYVAFYSTGMTKKIEYNIRNLKINVSIFQSENKDVDEKNCYDDDENIMEISNVEPITYDLSTKELVGFVDTLHIFENYNGTTIIRTEKVEDPIIHLLNIKPRKNI
uniref:Uncharacterized protein n=1 Tax=Parastrongyloides trichosuri TaxID=131310 RepID=A0A0N4ZSV0_PARTI